MNNLRGKREKVELTGDVEQIVSFVLGKESFAVKVSQVREIVKLQDITKVPKMTDFIEGVMNLRGQITTVIDLKKRFRICSDDARTNQSRIIVAEVGENHQIGIIVDAVEDVMRVPSASISPPPKTISNNIGSSFIVGICKLPNKLIIILDLNKVMDQSEIGKLSELENSNNTNNAKEEVST